ncbi:MAG TPA: nucleotidyl transferase AbiEii/AbiGii toxin family protein [Rhodanobacter sp.]|nr:nucleotidyl transferase AbiEii/AbiGii toxin family protein [Rhodanobacter sp.]
MIDLSSDRRLGPMADVVRAVQAQTGDTPILLVGATARDILLTYAHGIAIARGTADIDFALATQNWRAFESVRTSLIETGAFTAARGTKHRLLYKNGMPVDIIPFDGVEGTNRHIEWPPEHDVAMNVLGYREALHCAELVRLPGESVLSVISLPALMLVKLIAWSERRRDAPGKDAYDLYLVLRNYLDAGNQRRLSGDAAYLLDDTFDYNRTGAWLLGADARSVLEQPGNEQSITIITNILEPQVDPAGTLRLAAEMDRADPVRALTLLQEFHKGFLGRR